MSFFDEVEETRVEPGQSEARRRRRGGNSRPPSGGRRPPGRSAGGKGRPPVDQNVIRVRQGVALTALVIVLVLVVIGVHSCQVSQANTDLRNYNDGVAALIRKSNHNGQQVFSALAGGLNSNNVSTVQSQVNTARLDASNQVNRAAGLSAPGSVGSAQQHLELLMQMRRDAIANIARNLQPALQNTTAASSVNTIAAEMARLYASDVLYKDYTLPSIVNALRKAGIAVGGANGQPIATGQLVPDVQWLLPSYVASQLRVSVPGSTSGKIAPGVHGHELDGCSVGNTALSTSSATSVPGGSAPTFTCTVTNDGQNTETNVVVSASVGGTSITGQATIPQTQPGQQYTVQISLNSTPPAGTYNVTVTVQHVPGETSFTHNTKIFPVTFG